MSVKPAFYGKYRGIVSDTNDLDGIGRIRARVPDVTSSGETGWAMPCVPFAGGGMGFFALPPVGSPVWIEFESGDPDRPIWTGGHWLTRADVPSDVAMPLQTGKVLLRTDGGASILLDDTPGKGGIILTTPSGQRLSITSTSIEIDNGSGATITLTGPQVSINNGALDVS